MENNLLGKVIVITGGSDGLGRESAKLLSKENTVIILGRDKDRLETSDFDNYICDVTKPKEAEEVISKIYSKYGRIDCFINNAGTLIVGKLEDNSFDKISEVIDVNVKGVINMTKIVVPYMKKQGNGLIINVDSTAGVNWKENYSVYTSSKWAITGFTKAMQSELLKQGIRVEGFYPGTIRTKLFEKNGLPDKDLTNALKISTAAKAIKFMIDQDDDVVITDLGIKHMYN